MSHRFLALFALLLLGFGIFTPQSSTFAVTVTYTSCPLFSTLETDASTPGIITFNVAGGCTIIFDDAIYIDHTLTITNIGGDVTFDGDGEEFHFDIDAGGNLTLNNLILYNGYSEPAGSIFNMGVLTVTNSVFDDNHTDYDGGAIYNCCGTVTINNTLFIDNEAYYGGGAIYNSGGTVTITGGAFDNNNADEYGGAISSDGTLIITGTHFENNQSDYESGGAIAVYDSSLTVTDSTFEGNYANSGYGGAIYQEDGDVTIIGSSFYDNYAIDGGVVSNDYGLMFISNSSFYNNEATFGGALYTLEGVIDVTNSTIYGNRASSAGGGILNDNGFVLLTHVTLVNNSDDDGGGNYSTNSDMAIIASIIAAGECQFFGGTTTDGGNNIQFNAAGCVGTNTDPMLGGFTGGYMIPATGSPAIDAIAVCLVSDDQIGTARPQGAGCDIGAIEGGGGFVVPLPTGPQVLGCVFDTPSGMSISNLPDNTYCTVLMRNGGVVNYAGAVPAELINLGVIFAVDVYRLEGGRSIVEFPDYGRVCLRGTGRMFYMDARNAPRYPIQMPTEEYDGMTCAWIPAAGTLILTND